MESLLSDASTFLKYYATQIARLDQQDASAHETIRGEHILSCYLLFSFYFTLLLFSISLFLTFVADLNSQEVTVKKQIAQLQQQHLLAFRREVSVVLSAPAATKVFLPLYSIPSTPFSLIFSPSGEHAIELHHFERPLDRIV